MNPIKKLTIAVAGFGVLLALVGGAVLYPLIRGIFDISTEIQEKKDQFLREQKEGDAVKDFQRFSKDQEQALSSLSGTRINSELPIDFVQFLEQIAASFGFKLTIVPGAVVEAKGEPWKSMRFTVSSKGSYRNLFKMIKQLENAPFLVDIEGANIKKAGDASREGIATQGDVEFSLQIKAYTK